MVWDLSPKHEWYQIYCTGFTIWGQSKTMASASSAFKPAIEAGLRGETDLTVTLPTITADGLSDADRHQAIETAFRQVLGDRIVANDVDPAAITVVIDAAISLAQAKLCPSTTPHTLLDDAFDMSVLEVCEHVFTFVESRLDAWSEAPFSGVGPRNVMLRLCNALSARLSNTRDTVLSGRILLFLASVTPLQDKSGINMGSQFNTGNITTYDDEEVVAAAQEHEPAAAAESDDTKSAESDKPGDSAVDYVFYRQFWTLQKYFTTPTLCYANSGWSEFLQSLKSVMHSFTVNKLDRSLSASEPSRKTAGPAAEGEDAETPYFPKFLTSSKLFHLELADSGFRRQIMVQMLVLFHYLTGEVKFKKDTHKLSKLQTDTVGKMQAAVYILLKTTPPNGDKFTDAVRRVLASEHEWVKWKNESCPDFFRDSVELRKRKSPGVGEVGGGEAKKAKGAGERDLGSAELSRLWSLSETNLDGCESAVESGRFIPDVGSYFKEAIEQVAGANPVDKRFWVFTDQTDYNWRALRLLGKDRLHYFQDFNQVKTLEEYIEVVVKKLAAEQRPIEEKGAKVLSPAAAKFVPKSAPKIEVAVAAESAPMEE